MQKKGEISRLAVNIIIGVLILALIVIIYFIVSGIMKDNKYKVLDDSQLDLKISQVKKINDNTLDLTLKRNSGEGEFIGLSFAAEDDSTTEVIRINGFIPENESGNFSLNFLLMNASKLKKISVTPIYLDKEGKEVLGKVKDEYITPDTCSNYCPPNAQCGYSDCGLQCGNGCSSGYFCLNYKCIKESTSSGGGGGSSGGSSTTTTCTDTCSSLVYQCGTQTICGQSVNCGTCSTGYVCSSGLCIENSTCTDTCSSLKYTCGTHSICGVSTNCGTCSTGYTCAVNGTCMKDCVPTTCLALGRTCGTVSDGCSGTLNCGTCSTGYTCAVNGTCIKNVVIDCGTVTCNSGEYCSNGVCLLTVAGNTYFVAVNGNDNNPGTFEQPFATWQKGVDVAHAGDIVYIRGGVYMFTEHIAGSAPIGMLIDPVGYGVGRSGTAQAPIRYYNYPGETPILDGSLATPNSNRWNGGIGVDNAEYLYFRGLTIRNIYQTPPDPSHVKVYSEAFGFGANGANFKFENIIVHDIDGRGFTHWSGAWNEVDGPGALFNSDNTSWINCDAYNLYDRYAMEPGNAADGWKVQGYEGNYFYWEGCRAWNYADDGFDPSGSEYRTFKNCWAMSTDKYKDLSSLWAIEGNGFKVTGVNIVSIPDYIYGAENYVRFENCIAADNIGVGFYNNIVVNYQDQLPNGAIFYNNLAYRNGIGYSDADGSIYRNNIAYAAQQTEATGNPYEVYLYETTVDTVANTWISTGMVDADWWWEYNPNYTVTNADFVSLDTSQLTAPRKADGSLPDITFGHLAQGSDLINRGVNVGLSYSGSAPDLGPFESSY